jgi:hypothetical protein
MEMKSQTPLAIFGEFGVYDIIAGATAPMWAGGEHVFKTSCPVISTSTAVVRALASQAHLLVPGRNIWLAPQLKAACNAQGVPAGSETKPHNLIYSSS